VPGGLFDPRTTNVGTSPFGASAQGFHLDAGQCLIHAVPPINGAWYGPSIEGQPAGDRQDATVPRHCSISSLRHAPQAPHARRYVRNSGTACRGARGFHRRRLEKAPVHVPFTVAVTRLLPATNMDGHQLMHEGGPLIVPFRPWNEAPAVTHQAVPE